MTWLDAVLGALAVFRLTRLVTEDDVWDGTRDRLVAWSEQARELWPVRTRWVLRSKVGVLVVCPWCVSVYVAGLVVAGWWVLPLAVWRSGCAVLAASAVAGLVATWEQRQ